MDELTQSAKVSNVIVHYSINAPGTGQYKPLRFEIDISQDGICNQIAADWINWYRPENDTISSIKKMKEMKNIPITWINDNQQVHSSTINWSKVRTTVKEKQHFDHKELNIPENAKVPWMDRSLNITMDYYWPDNQNKIPGDTTVVKVLTELGEHFPLRPGLDREGFCYAPLMTFLYKAINNARCYLVENSQQMFTLADEWMQNFFTYFNASISLFESSLNQIYFKAKYDPKDDAGRGKESKLIFDESRLGSVVSAKLMDKLKWVRICTGLDLETNEHRQSIELLRQVRNHINHFNPPVMACTAEELARWLNMSIDIGRLLWKIRKLMHLPPSKELCTLILTPKVLFVPRNPSQNRGILKKEAGYASSCWQTAAPPSYITGVQCRAARALLDWTRRKLAEAARTSETEIEEFEKSPPGPPSDLGIALKRILQTAGMEFLPAGEKGEGVRFSNP